MRRAAKLSPVLAVVLLAGCQHNGETKAPTEVAANPEVAGPPAVAPAPAVEAKPRIGAPMPIPVPVVPPSFVIPKAPEHLPTAEDSKENPTTPQKVLLGYALFFDKRLSKDDSMACEGCHHIDKAYTSGNPLDAKVGGAMNKRNAPTMLNLAYATSYYWDGRKPTLEAVSQAAWTGQLGADPKVVAAKLAQNPTYVAHFQAAFNEGPTGDNIPKALGSFLRELKSGNAPFDRFEKGDEKAVSKDVKAGFEVFKKANCALCHAPPLYTDEMFHNVGVGVEKAEADRDHGRKDATKDEADEGKFKTPTMREIAKTGPYFHDGSAKTLDAAIDFMVGGGKKNPLLDEKLKPSKLSKKERQQLKLFLESLSGTYTFPTGPELP